MLLAISKETLAVILVIVCTLPILLLALWAIITALRNNKKKIQNLDEEANAQPKDLEQREAFYDAYGGVDNVISISVKMNRLTVKVHDIDKVLTEELKVLGANNVYLVNDEVKCSYGDRASYIYKLME